MVVNVAAGSPLLPLYLDGTLVFARHGFAGATAAGAAAAGAAAKLRASWSLKANMWASKTLTAAVVRAAILHIMAALATFCATAKPGVASQLAAGSCR